MTDPLVWLVDREDPIHARYVTKKARHVVIGYDEDGVHKKLTVPWRKVDQINEVVES